MIIITVPEQELLLNAANKLDCRYSQVVVATTDTMNHQDLCKVYQFVVNFPAAIMVSVQ